MTVIQTCSPTEVKGSWFVVYRAEELVKALDRLAVWKTSTGRRRATRRIQRDLWEAFAYGSDVGRVDQLHRFRRRGYTHKRGIRLDHQRAIRDRRS